MGRKIKLKKISSRILTLSYPKYRFFTFLLVLMILLIVPVGFLEKSPNLSICSNILGDNCPSKGISRGVSSLLKGDFPGAIDYNIMSVPVLTIMVLFLIHDFHKTFIKRV
ncbi:DUF2752 domain-containing protein [Nanoarchaeota archaeon]